MMYDLGPKPVGVPVIDDHSIPRKLRIEIGDGVCVCVCLCDVYV